MTVREWLRDKAKVIGMYAGAIGAVLAAVISWNTLGWDRPALVSDVTTVRETVTEQVAGLEGFAKGTRKLVLGQEWERLDRQIRELESQPSRTRAEDERLSSLRKRKRDVEEQLRALQ